MGIRKPLDDNGNMLDPSRFPSWAYTTPLAGNGNVSQPWIDSTATGFTYQPGSIYDVGSSGPQDVNFVSGSVYTDQAGTLYIDQTDDRVNIQSVAIPVSAATLTAIPVTQLTSQFYRFRYVNGATAQTSILIAQISERIDAFSQVQVSGSNVGDSQTLWTPGMLYNGITSDKPRNNTQGTLLASLARTTTTSSPIQTNYNAKGVIVTLNVTAASGTGGLSLRIQGIEPVTLTPYAISANPTVVTTTGLHIYVVYPGASGGPVDVVTSEPLPRNWVAQVAHGDASSYTYSVGYALIN